MWREGKKLRQKSFKTKAEAKKFAAALELAPAKKQSLISVAALIEDYVARVTPTKRGAREESFRLMRLAKRPFAAKRLSEITTADIDAYSETRILEASNKYNKTLSPTTLMREIMSLSVVFNDAVRRGLMETIGNDIDVCACPTSTGFVS